ARTAAAAARAALDRVFRLGPRPARTGAPGVGVADQRRRSRSDFQYAAGSHVGSGDSPSRRRSQCAASQPRDTLSGSAADRLIMTFTARLATALAVLILAPLAAFEEKSVPDTLKLQKMAARFAPTDIGADVSKLAPA